MLSLTFASINKKFIQNRTMRFSPCVTATLGVHVSGSNDSSESPVDFIIKLVTTLFQIRACVIMHAQQNILTSQQFHFTVFTYMYSHVPPQTIILCIQCTVFKLFY